MKVLLCRFQTFLASQKKIWSFWRFAYGSLSYTGIKWCQTQFGLVSKVAQPSQKIRTSSGTMLWVYEAHLPVLSTPELQAPQQNGGIADADNATSGVQEPAQSTTPSEATITQAVNSVINEQAPIPTLQPASVPSTSRVPGHMVCRQVFCATALSLEFSLRCIASCTTKRRSS